MTTTPKIFGDTPQRKLHSRRKLNRIMSMDDEKIYGPEFHTLSFKNAVEKRLLTDYKVIIFMVGEKHTDDPDLPAKIKSVY